MLTFQLQVRFDDLRSLDRVGPAHEGLLHRACLSLGGPRLLPPQDPQAQDRTRSKLLFD
jgi:hypothetical protein